MSFKVPVGVSARHLHLSQEHVEILFGNDYKLTHFKDLSQPGQYACNEKVNIVSLDPKGKTIEGVRVLGPTRENTQVELSRSDAIRNRIEAPVRSSGDISGTGKCKIVGPCGEVTIAQGVIVADRHIHLSSEEGEMYGINDREIVSIKVEGKKGGIMHNVLCRVHKNFKMDFHIDTDDACAFDLNQGDLVEVIK